MKHESEMHENELRTPNDVCFIKYGQFRPSSKTSTSLIQSKPVPGLHIT